MSTYKELKRLTLNKLARRSDGLTTLAVADAINKAQTTIARVKDFEELKVLDTTNAFTVVNQKMYHIINDLKLVRPKDFYTIRYMNTSSSKKLTYVPLEEFDRKVPYTEQGGYGDPSYYIRRGKYLEFYRIPDKALPLYIMHSQWPLVLVADADESSYDDEMDDVIVSLAVDMTNAELDGTGAGNNWIQRARQALGMAEKEADYKPDRILVAQPFDPYASDSCVGEWWADPFIRRDP